MPRPRSSRRPDDGPAPLRPEPALVRAVERVGDRWVLLIVAGLLDGPRRFGALSDGLGVAPNILTARLRQLEEDGLVVARPYNQRPVRNEYALTRPGRELADTLTHLSEWGARRRGGPSTAAFHSRCGTALEVRPWCPTCDRTVDGDDAADGYEV